MNEFLIFQRMISILNICRECYLKKRKKKVIIEGYRVIGSFYLFFFFFLRRRSNLKAHEYAYTIKIVV